MDKQEALRRLHEIVNGIDRDESEDEAGWWETSEGVKFGTERLRLLESLISDLTE